MPKCLSAGEVELSVLQADDPRLAIDVGQPASASRRLAKQPYWFHVLGSFPWPPRGLYAEVVYPSIVLPFPVLPFPANPTTLRMSQWDIVLTPS
jgi:hypothetical protein